MLGTPLQTAVQSFEDKYLTKFQPTTKFYPYVGINRIRFWQLVEGKKRPTYDEAVSLSKYFGLPLEVLFNQNPTPLARK
ncbi:hypothetical protein DR864_09120 [Runella rosea]|uniref:HTH cro/C1-type domain-containing protein n=1 Tax=Runella rosea TaxID=2259595 RepID=A0A344TGV9_9BACT|nr:hypothetical protein [Runella rosea]AXE17880.1 hypothetical protein DR864_09120 [Runella rosea]